MQITEELQQFVERLQQAAGENLESMVLYGSAARDDFSEQHSDVNLLCLIRDASGSALERLGPSVEWWSGTRHHRPPLFLTPEELRTSADVFAIETLDIKENHRILAGRDLLATIEVPMNLHRVQLEHDLRIMVLKLRQHYLLSPDEQHLERALAKSVSSFTVLLRHALIALGHTPPPGSKRELLLRGSAVLGIDLGALHAALDLREGRRLEIGIAELYQRCMQLAESLVHLIDEAAPKKEWQRVTDPSR